jgi:hypothetical protein
VMNGGRGRVRRCRVDWALQMAGRDNDSSDAGRGSRNAKGDARQRQRMGEVLFEAVKAGDVERVRFLCEQGQDGVLGDAGYADEFGVRSVRA